MTIAHTLSPIVFHFNDNKAIIQKLQKELRVSQSLKSTRDLSVANECEMSLL